MHDVEGVGAQTAYLALPWPRDVSPKDAGINKVLHIPVTVHKARRQPVACGICRTCGGKIREALHKSDWTLVDADQEGPGLPQPNE